MIAHLLDYGVATARTSVSPAPRSRPADSDPMGYEPEVERSSFGSADQRGLLWSSGCRPSALSVLCRYDPSILVDAYVAFGRVAASLRLAGPKTQARAYDAMIAVTALANNLPVYTGNPDDVAGIEDLTVVTIPMPDSEGPQAISRQRR